MSEYMYLAHHGVKGQKHGFRQWQNPDGSLTPAGRIHYGVGKAREAASAVGKVIKSKTRELKYAARESAKISKQRRAVRAEERAEKDRARAEATRRKYEHQIAARQQKLFEQQSKKTLREINLEIRRNRVDKLIKKQAQIKEAEALRVQEAMLKKSMKTARKYARKTAEQQYGKRKISSLSDQELDQRIARLKKEAEARRLEEDRSFGGKAKNKLLDAAVNSASQVLGNTTRDLLTAAAKKHLNLDEKDLKAKTKDLQDALQYSKARDDLREYQLSRSSREKSRNQDAQDESLRKLASRLQSMTSIAENEAKLAKPQQSKMDKEDEERKKLAARLQTEENIAGSRRRLNGEDSLENATKRLAAEQTKRKELERRALAYYSIGKDSKGNPDGRGGLTISEIASRMGLTESQVKDLLYMR